MITRIIRSAEKNKKEELKISQLPNGVFGFTTPWSLNDTSRQAAGNITLGRTMLRTSDTESHKTREGKIFVLVYVDESSLPQLQNPERVDTLDMTAFLKPHVQQSSTVSLKRIAALLLTVNSHISSQNTDTGGHMSKAWQVQEAKARFSEFLEASVREGPQIVTKRGVEAAVLLSIEQWRGLRVMAKPDLKEWLLAPEARMETLTTPRTRHRHRPTLAFE